MSPLDDDENAFRAIPDPLQPEAASFDKRAENPPAVLGVGETVRGDVGVSNSGVISIGEAAFGFSGWTEAAPTREQMRARRFQALALSTTWLLAHIAVYGVRENMRTLPTGYLLAQIAAPALLGLVSLLVALSPGRLGLGLAVGVTATLAIGGPLSFLLAAVGVPPPLPVNPGTWLDHLLCLDLTLVWMAAPLLLGAFYLRRSFVGEVRYRSALFGSACGLFAGATMNLHCASVEQLHVVLGHAVPVGAACLLGAYVFSKISAA